MDPKAILKFNLFQFAVKFLVQKTSAKFPVDLRFFRLGTCEKLAEGESGVENGGRS